MPDITKKAPTRPRRSAGGGGGQSDQRVHEQGQDAQRAEARQDAEGHHEPVAFHGPYLKRCALVGLTSLWTGARPS